MRNLAAWCHDRRRTVIGIWVAAFVGIALLWGAASGEFVNNFQLPGTESQRAYDLLKERFPAQAGDTASVVFAVKDGKVLDQANHGTIDAAIAEIKKSPEVLTVGDPYAKGRLLTVQSIELTESQEKGFPNLDAVLVLNAHVYDGPIPPATPVTPPASSGDGTETTSTATAAGATP